ncbi:MAG: SEL1-like repeat protein [Gammaproteobacteria bacterium]|nr:SEL1-like repeat protein [Gammaproteobacteria bacterium]MBU1723072.1 SEL1-like repeat protein [Gammaproteobacteria bacterium]MBU2004142.1 SEL1-like repeat protein [Gammaproteobacteria bacterium]
MLRSNLLTSIILLGAFAIPPVLASELDEAKAAYDAAFERYTKLVTTDAGAGDVLQALEEYKQAHIRYMTLSNSARPPPEPQATSEAGSLDTSGIEGIVSIDDAPTTAPPQSAPTDKTALEKQAQAGNPQAMEVLALTYQSSYNGQADPYRAIELLKQAAKAGDANAMVALAEEYESGLWIKQDNNKANTLRTQAAKLGSRLAEWELESHE